MVKMMIMDTMETKVTEKDLSMIYYKVPQIRDFPHEVLQTEEKCAFD